MDFSSEYRTSLTAKERQAIAKRLPKELPNGFSFRAVQSFELGNRMTGFFCGRKRKAGVVALVVACALTAGWIRSRAIADSVAFTTRQRTILCGSEDSCMSITIYDRGDTDLEWPDWTTSPLDQESGATSTPLLFTFTQHEAGLLPLYYLVIPYRTIVIPLTLLSGWLLLSKRRQQHPASCVEIHQKLQVEQRDG